MVKKSTTRHKSTKSSKVTKAKPSTQVRATTATKPKSGTTTNKASKPTVSKVTADQYNDPSHNYLHYWDGRDYEDAAERIALKRLLKGKKFRHAVDIGGGYGRLCVFLQDYADKVTLAEPSQQQLDIAEDFLREHKRIDKQLVEVQHLPFKDGSVDLFTMIRVMHHLPEPEVPFSELHRALSDDGYLILEMANYTHFRNRLKHLMKGKSMPIAPVDIRSEENKKNAHEIPFVNHNPHTVIKQLAHAGLKVEKTLSVSNLRSPGLKKVMPKGLMIALEKTMQKPLANMHFGPSVFFLVKKAK